jgi:hypothetical protein
MIGWVYMQINKFYDQSHQFRWLYCWLLLLDGGGGGGGGKPAIGAGRNGLDNISGLATAPALFIPIFGI